MQKFTRIVVLAALAGALATGIAALGSSIDRTANTVQINTVGGDRAVHGLTGAAPNAKDGFGWDTPDPGTPVDNG